MVQSAKLLRIWGGGEKISATYGRGADNVKVLLYGCVELTKTHTYIFINVKVVQSDK